MALALVSIVPARDGVHKYLATFNDNGVKRMIKFGAVGYEDYTQHKDPNRRLAYIARHRAREDWNNPMTPGALSRFILWEKTSLRSALLDYRRRFRLM